MALIATPFLTLLAWITVDAPPAPSLCLIPVFCIVWAFSRPVFVFIRIQESSSRRPGTVLIHAFAFGTILLLGIGWLLSGFVTLACCIAFWQPDSSAERLENLLYGLAGLVTSPLCARAVFEIKRLLIARRMVNW